MKKILGLLLVTCLCICAASSILAEDTENQVQLDQNTMSGTTTVSFTVDNSADSFTVVIPSTITIDPKTQRGQGDITLKSGFNMVSINGLDVRLTSSENATSDGFFLKSSDGTTAKYSISHNSLNVPGTFTNFKPSDYSTINLLHIGKGGVNTKDLTVTIKINVSTMPTVGVYTDTLTFSIIPY